MSETEVGKTTIEEQLRLGKSVITYTKGTSMKPLLIEGKSYVVVSPITEPLSVGDIPIFRRFDGKYVLHRLIRMDENYYYTRGDNCIGVEQVPRAELLGVVTEISRKGKKIMLDSRGYRTYVAVWRALTPVRIFFYKVRAKVGSG